MKEISQTELEGMLIGIISDGFNRSLCALENKKAVKRTAKFREKYKGVGSEFYDLVTEEIKFTAHYGAKSLLERLQKEDA